MARLSGAGDRSEPDDLGSLLRRIEIWCGNSCHRVLLGPGEYWEFATPRYGGDFETKLRFRLTDADGTTLLLSNEFDGSIHQEQFALPTVDESI